MIDAKTRTQFTRYAVVGLTSNLVLYFVYLGLTMLGMGHKSAMTLVYIVGVTQTFYFNRNWSFRHDGHVSSALLRYVTTYALGYLFNLVVLMLLVDHWGWPHQWVQGVMIFILAALLFVMQRYWVFRSVTVSA